jgi:formylglycine-generating enzyme required for sulfatase activity
VTVRLLLEFIAILMTGGALFTPQVQRHRGLFVATLVVAVFGLFYTGWQFAQGLRQDGEQTEIAFWESVERHPGVRMYRLYLERYPDGRFVDIAQEELRKFSPPPPAAPPPPVVSTPAPRPACPDCPEIEMVDIPGGEFWMGSDDGDQEVQADEKPRHQMKVAAFRMGKYEVTQGQWKAVMGLNPSHFKDCGDDCPVENVSYNDVQEFIRKLNAKTGMVYRLPTEAEWEYAARAGTVTPFSTGSCLTTDQANYDGNYPPAGCPKGVYRERTVAVGSLNSPNPWGLHDLHGNVWEWVEDCWHDSYQDAPGDGSAWTTGDCARRVLRGGSWFSSGRDARSAYRYASDPGSRLGSVGFRLVPGRAASGQAGK